MFSLGTNGEIINRCLIHHGQDRHLGSSLLEKKGVYILRADQELQSG